MNGLKQIFTPAPPRYYTPERLKEEIVVHIPPTGSRPDRVPTELQNHVPKIIWDERLVAIQTRASMYNKPLLERIYLAFAVLAVFILPVGLYQIISRSMTLNMEQEQTAKYFFQAKAITFAIFLGTILVFFAPLFFWRWFGQRRMTALITSWAQSDRRASTSPPPSSPSGGGPPTWKCEVPGLFRSTARLTITIPRKSERSASAFGFYGDSYMSARDFDREVFGTMRSEKALAGGGPGKMGGRGTHDSYVGTINLFQPSPTRSAFGGPGAREKV